MPKKAAPSKQKHDDNKLTGDFSEQEILEFREAFAMFDMDGGGTYLWFSLSAILDCLLHLAYLICFHLSILNE